MSKASSYSEVDAMRDVDSALSQLDAGAQQRVIQWASSKHRIKPTAGQDETPALTHALGGDHRKFERYQVIHGSEAAREFL